MFTHTTAVLMNDRHYLADVDTAIAFLFEDPKAALDFRTQADITVIAAHFDADAQAITVTYSLLGELETEKIDLKHIEIITTKESI